MKKIGKRKFLKVKTFEDLSTSGLGVSFKKWSNLLGMWGLPVLAKHAVRLKKDYDDFACQNARNS